MGKMGEAMNNNGTDRFEGTLDALDGITEGTGLRVKPSKAEPIYNFRQILDDKLDEVLFGLVTKTNPNRYMTKSRADARRAIKQLIASELGAIIDANIDPDHAIDTDRVYEALVEWIGELQGGGDE